MMREGFFTEGVFFAIKCYCIAVCPNIDNQLVMQIRRHEWVAPNRIYLPLHPYAFY
jgi:hypothetical protein